ncbi:3D domain-containing protein [Psychrobacillus sp. FSL H8-0484]|uniref:3D domain-containing protein n=1 Tax=Psychrobacillus sp. FSL H8-0484 TaxID=2921390 RepID=UPI0030F70EF8
MLKVKTLLVIALLAFSTNSVTYAAEISTAATNAEDVAFTSTTENYVESILDSSGEIDIHFLTAFELRKALEFLREPTVYTVVEGDNLYRIALEHNVPLETLMSWNDLTGSLIHPGEELVVSGEGEEGITHMEFDSDKVVATTSPIQPPPPVDDSVEDSNQVVSAPPATEDSTEMLVTATAYTAYCAGCSGTTAYGIDLRANPDQKVIAVDPKIIPLGTKVWVEGYGEAIAGDTGGAIKGNKIDVFIPSHESAMEWGVKKVIIRVLD